MQDFFLWNLNLPPTEIDKLVLHENKFKIWTQKQVYNSLKNISRLRFLKTGINILLKFFDSVNFDSCQLKS
jgi:hypothetical protein